MGKYGNKFYKLMLLNIYFLYSGQLKRDGVSTSIKPAPMRSYSFHEYEAKLGRCSSFVIHTKHRLQMKIIKDPRLSLKIHTL